MTAGSFSLSFVLTKPKPIKKDILNAHLWTSEEIYREVAQFLIIPNTQNERLALRPSYFQLSQMNVKHQSVKLKSNVTRTAPLKQNWLVFLSMGVRDRMR